MLIELKNITIHYGKAKAVEDVSMGIEEGAIATMIGANGSGKSTVLKAISGLHPLSSGEIYFRGERIDGKAPHEIVGMGLIHVPEGRRLFPHLTVFNNLKLGASLRKDKNGIKNDLNKVFDLFPILSNRSRQKAGTMSGGEQQMLAIGRGIMAKPKLLILDEPSLGLAPRIVEGLVPVIKHINQMGVTVLLVEQNIPLALKIASTAYALKVGKVILEGEIDKFKNNDLIQKAYLGA